MMMTLLMLDSPFVGRSGRWRLGVGCRCSLRWRLRPAVAAPRLRMSAHCLLLWRAALTSLGEVIGLHFGSVGAEGWSAGRQQS